MKRSRRYGPIQPRGVQHAVEADQRSRAVGAIKRLQRRLQRGQDIPFILALIEPRKDDQGNPRAVPVILGNGMFSPSNRFLVRALIGHLAKVGMLQIGEDGAVMVPKDDAAAFGAGSGVEEEEEDETEDYPEVDLDEGEDGGPP